MSYDKDYKLTKVVERDEWESKSFGTFKDYAVQFEGEEGWAKLTQKVETPVPAEGSSLYGHFEISTNPNTGVDVRKFKKAQRGMPQSGGNSGSADRLAGLEERLAELEVKYSKLIQGETGNLDQKPVRDEEEPLPEPPTGGEDDEPDLSSIPFS